MVGLKPKQADIGYNGGLVTWINIGGKQYMDVLKKSTEVRFGKLSQIVVCTPIFYTLAMCMAWA